METEIALDSPQFFRPTAGRLLRRWLSDEIQSRPAYSLRTMARTLGISPSFLSQVMNGHKRISLDRAVQFSQVLQFDETATEALIDAARADAPRSKKNFRSVELESFKVLSQWFHIAILDLSETLGFISEPNWIARRLKISAMQAADALDRLRDLKLLVESSNGLRKEQSRLVFSTETSNAQIREYHKQMIGKALDCLEDATPEAFEKRSITGTTMAINPSHLPKIFETIDRLRKTLERQLSTGECTEVYQLNIQLFNLSHALPNPTDHRGHA